MESIQNALFNTRGGDWSASWGLSWASASGRWGQEDAKQRLAEKRTSKSDFQSEPSSPTLGVAERALKGQDHRHGLPRDPNRTSIPWENATEISERTPQRFQRGLSNENGANHCFLNVAIQTFWNIRTFRERFLREPEHVNCKACKLPGSMVATAVGQDPSAPVDLSRIQSRENFSMQESQECNSKAQGILVAENCCFCALKAVMDNYQSSDEEVLPPDTLRRALSNAYGTKGRFRLGEMEDATETIEALLDVFHAHTVYEQAGYWQLTLDAQHKGKIKERMEKASAADLAEEAAEHACSPQCISHEVFGIEYVDLARCTFCGATGEPSTIRSFLYPVYVADHLTLQGQSVEVATASDTTYASAVQARMQSFAASWQTVQPTFQELVHRLANRDVKEKCKECQSLNTMVSERWLTKHPLVFVVSLVWPSATPPKESLWQTLSTIRPLVSMDQMFRTEIGSTFSAAQQPRGSVADATLPTAKVLKESYFFRGMICFYGCHYVSFFWSWPKMKWILFDDTRLKEEEDWSSVVQIIMAGQYVPTVLFYELNDGMYKTADMEFFVQQVSTLEDRSSSCSTM